jgi:hypothetical protein
MSGDEVVFLAVLVLRLGIPLLIPRFPFPAIVASLVIDAADQTVFQQFTDLDLEGYQGYDKALDNYYLTVAYLSTLRNWIDPVALKTARFLWYYRLLGVTLFELTEVRALLLVFPNTFEYFFIFYEGVRLLWDPRRLGTRQIVGAAAAIWIFVKLPQEWWIHIAQLDFTDFMKEDVLGVEATTPWSEALGENLWFVALLAVVAVGVALGVRSLRRHLPPPDWPLTFDVDRHLDPERLLGPRRPVAVLSWPVFEKVALMTMITIIFAQVLPDNEATPMQIAFGVTFVVVANATVSHLLLRGGHTWRTTGRQFLGMLVVNAIIVLTYIALLRSADRPINEGALVFFVLLLTLIVTLFDRYRGRSTPVPA